tara:strand:+ start:692 stop:1063 length:372 start_codon:yes stop_codon:yes gene_type:complete
MVDQVVRSKSRMTGESRRSTDGNIVIPFWLAPMLLAAFVILGLGYVVSLSAKDAQQRVDTHAKDARVRIVKLEESDKGQHTNMLLIRQELEYLTDETEKTSSNIESNNRLLNRIANKLDVEMD